jgi:hypothetical protein
MFRTNCGFDGLVVAGRWFRKALLVAAVTTGATTFLAAATSRADNCDYYRALAQQYLRAAQRYNSATYYKLYQQTMTWVNQNCGSGSNREIWYRAECKERYLYRDRYGRLYWSNWQSAGTIERPTRALVESQVRGWLEGDPYRRYGWVSRAASPITPSYH